ncbi:MAG: hypothetical protein H6735_01410 [Alphaproteobacteria bacterium]|nr:hypothetical protein [Alphaproteobacteria bacterium]
MLAWVWSGVAVAGCLGRTASSTLADRLQDAEKAYADLDSEGFQRAMDDATLLLPCLGDLPSANDAARYHRLDAMMLYGAGNEDAAIESLVAARMLDPAFAFTDALLPADHELRRTYESLGDDPGDDRRPPQPRRGALAFDGVLSPRQPLDRATIVQWVDDGEVLGTRLLRPGDDLPAFDARPRDRNRLLVASGALLATSAAFYGLAWSTHGPFWDTSQDLRRADLARLQSESITFTAVSAGTGALGIGGLVLAFTWADDGKAPPGARW